MKEDMLKVEPWSVEKTWEWYNQETWLIGFNFLPSTAVNSTDMWQDESFDVETIKKELGWAARIGFNSCRVFLQYLVWKADSEGLKGRVNKFLTTADKNGISTILVLFDDCNFDNREPFLGKQLNPIPGVHNSRWTPSPGHSIADNKAEWPMLEKYVKDIVSSFANNGRVVVWDLYYERKTRPESGIMAA